MVVGLDTSVDRADRILEQQTYARAELAGPERWKFVIFHHPVYSSDAYHGSGYGYETIYHPIFVEAGVDIVFNGHAHNYERIEVDGVIVPRARRRRRRAARACTYARRGFRRGVENHNFYARVSAAPDKISVDIVSVAEATETTFVPTPGELLDSFTLAASTSRGLFRCAVQLPGETQTSPESLAPIVAVSSVETQTPSQTPPRRRSYPEWRAKTAAATPVQTQSECAMPSIAELIALLAWLAIAAWALLRAGH